MDPKLIYDIGMCAGDDTAYYLHLGYNVIAAEPNPEMVEQAKKRFAAEIGTGRLTLVPAAVSATAGEQNFFLYTSPENASLARHGLKVTKEIMVPTVKLDTLMNKYGVPFYLKVDTEGNEAEVVRGLSRDDLPQYVSIELWGIESTCLLYALGYRKYKVVDQPSLWGTSCRGWKFTQSSGPFGEDIPGEWVPLDGILLQWLKYLAHEPSTFADARWYDLHASL